MRTDLALANLREFVRLHDAARPVHALEMGGGNGSVPVRLAGLGAGVALLDSSSATLDLKTAIQSGDLAAAERNLNAEFARESLLGG